MGSSRRVLARLEAAGDRLQEAHFFLHGMENAYHFADPFRWQLNAFLRPLKEVPQLVTVAIQGAAQLVAWHRDRVRELREDPLIDFLAEQRDFVVHQGMLVPHSSAMIGLTEGRGMKLGIGHSLDPHMDSDPAMQAAAKVAVAGADVLGILSDDETSLPAIERKWVLGRFPEIELADLCANAWLKVGDYIKAVMSELGVDLSSPDLSCRHGQGRFRIRAYDRAALRQGMAQPVAI